MKDLRNSTKPANISDDFVICAKQQPSNIAIKDSVSSLSYSQLEAISQSFANLLLSEVSDGDNHVTNTTVAIYGKRSARLIIAMLACARANLTFAVLDSAYPSTRIMQMLDLIEPAIIVGIDTTENELLAVQPQQEKYPVLTLGHDLHIKQTKLLASDIKQISNSIAYLLFTSGTTGIPKRIKTTHAPLAHFVDWYAETFDVSKDSQFSMLSGLGHDPVLRDIFVPLSTGATINIPDQSIIINPDRLFNWMKQSEISHIHATPQLLKILCAGAGDFGALPNIRYAISGGDALRVNQVHQLKKLNAKCQVVNFYGTTETPQAMAYYPVNHEDNDPIPVGFAISDVSLHLLNEDLTETQHGEVGQIGIETIYLSEGYLNDPSMTNGRFVSTNHTANKVYLTGDYGVKRADGALLLKGRMDDQIKIRGFRVELREIVAALELEDLVQSAIVLPQKNENGENYLVAYLVKSNETQALDLRQKQAAIPQIKARVSLKIPSYMVPNHYIWLDCLPLLPNGKLDRSKLPSVDEITIHTLPEVVNNAITETIVKEWRKVLGVTKLDPQKSFTELGGDSLSFIQASLIIEKQLGWLPDNWGQLSIVELADLPQKTSSHFTSMESPLLFRAISIVLIVMTHFTGTHISSTHALFFIAGISFGKFQLAQALNAEAITPILKTIAKIAIPTFLFILAIQLRHLDEIDLFNLALIGNLHSVDGEIRHFWFIEVLLQCYLMIAILLSFRKVRAWLNDHAFLIAITASLLTVTLASGMAIVVDDTSPTHAGSAINPINRLWLLFLGMSLSYADNFRRKIITASVSIVCFLASTTFDPFMVEVRHYLFPIIAILIIIFSTKITIPKISSTLIRLLASASLFIYLSHFTLGGHLDFYPFNQYNALKVIVMLCAGIVIWKLWETLTKHFNVWISSRMGRLTSSIEQYFKLLK